MNSPEQVIAGKLVPFNETQLEEAVQPPISDKVKQIVMASGVPALQELINTPSVRVAAVKLYWKKG